MGFIETKDSKNDCVEVFSTKCGVKSDPVGPRGEAMHEQTTETKARE